MKYKGCIEYEIIDICQMDICQMDICLQVILMELIRIHQVWNLIFFTAFKNCMSDYNCSTYSLAMYTYWQGFI